MDGETKTGRPSIYTQELADKICEEIALGRSLRKICEDENMPALSSIFKWFREKEGFSEQYDKATAERTETQQEIILDLGDKAIDHAQEVDPKTAGALVNAYKLKADNLKWSMSKMKPKKYGDKVDVTSGGEAIKANTLILKDFNGTDSQ